MQPCFGSRPVAVLGVPVDNVSIREVLARIDEWVAAGDFHQIATANTDFVLHAVRDEELSEILRRCDLVLPDGMPLVWASRMLGAPLRERVTGIDLVPEIAARAADHGYRMFLLGSTNESLTAAASVLRSRHPELEIVGTLAPPHTSLEAMNHEAILAEISRARPDILLVAFGNPKQEKWISMHRRRLEVPVAIGVGGSFDLLAGRVARAPQWMQRSGLEWLFRTMQEPGRLAARYGGNASGLIRHLPFEMAVYHAQHREQRLAQLRVECGDEVALLALSGDATGPVVERLGSAVADALAENRHVVLDLSETGFVGADAMAVLIRALRWGALLGREIWLSGMQPAVARAVKHARLGHSLRTAPNVQVALRRLEPAAPGWSPAGKERVLAFRPQAVPAATAHAFRSRVQGTSAMTPAPDEYAGR